MLERYLPNDRRLRALVLSVAAIVLLLVFTQLVLPGRGGGRGTPAAVLFDGFTKGCAAAITTVGVVLIYRTMRIINFAQVGMGIAGTILVFELAQFTPVPFPISLALGIALSALMGAALGILLLRFYNSARLYLTVVTIIAAGTIAGFAPYVRSLPFFPAVAKRTSVENDTSQDPTRLLPFRGLKFHVGSFNYAFGFRHLLAIELFAVVMIGLFLFLRYTKAGTAIRAMAENSERASLLGIGVGGLSILVWTVAGALGGAGVIANAALTSPGSATGIGVNVLLGILAAAVLARFTNLPIAVSAAIAISVLDRAWSNSFQDRTTMFDFILFVIIGVALLLQRRRGRSEIGGGVTWSATDEPRPVPQVLRELPTVRFTRWGIIGVGVLLLVAYPFLVSTRNVSLGSVIALNAIAVVSLVVLTGWAGQVSLAQFAFVAIGAVVGGCIVDKTPIPFWFAVPIAALVAGAVAILVGLPALRIPGLFLLVATFAFAVAVEELLFDERYFGWLLPKAVDRPTLFIIDFENERAMYYLSVATLLLAIVIVTNLRRSRIGRTLIAIRENEANARSFGVSAVRTKLVAFGIAGALCGMAGAVLAVQGRAVSDASFTAQASIDTFTAGVFGGVSTVGGALMGTAYFRIVGDLAKNKPLVQVFLQRGGTLFLVMAAPGGLIALVNAGRDSVLRVIAQRRQIVVPSLFSDYDADAEARQLISLGDIDPSSGLSALPSDTRFALDSELYHGRGERIIDKLNPKRGRQDTRAMAAAAKAAEDIDTGASV